MNGRRTLHWTAYSVSGLLTALSPAHADDATSGDLSDNSASTLRTLVIQATALQGTGIAADKVPGNVQVLSSADISADGSASLTRALDNRLGSVSIGDTLDDPYQPDILYRGFEASPVLGTAQGLAVYQNGVRINEAFGDTVNWDLLPNIAIERIELVSSSPVYGLNALGGGLSIRMKDGFSYQGAQAEASGGSFGNHDFAVQYGAHAHGFGIYVAGDALQNTGWRDFSNDSLRTLYVVGSAHSDRATLDLSYTRASNQLDGQGPAPVQELAVNRSLVFTGPQTNINRLSFLTLNGSAHLTDDWSLQAVGYYRQYQQVVANGNTTDFVACSSAPNLGTLCQSDGVTALATSTGQAIPDLTQGGTVNIGENDFETINAYGRGGSLQGTDTQTILDHHNSLVVGATLDYSAFNFLSGAQVGVVNSQLFVEPSPWTVDVTEDTGTGANPVNLKGFERNVGVYLTDTLDLTQAASVTASARYNSASIDLQDLRGTDLTGENRYFHINPAFGGTYKLSSAVTAYAGFAQNTRTPTASEIECSNPLAPCLLPTNLAGDPPTLKQVVAHTYELGLRGTLNLSDTGSGTLAWNLSAFRTNLQDDIYGISTSISSGFFANIGSTRRQGLEASLDYHRDALSAYLNYSLVDATFETQLAVPSPSNPQNDDGSIQVASGDRFPGIPQHRIKAGADYRVSAHWSVGGWVKFVSSSYYFGDESNQNPPLPSYQVVGLHGSYAPNRHLELFARIDNLFNARYATYGVFSDPTGVNAPGIPTDPSGGGVDPRFISPAYPFTIFGGVRLRL
jgi:iron complex outermembrane receptor protein